MTMRQKQDLKERVYQLIKWLLLMTVTTFLFLLIISVILLAIMGADIKNDLLKMLEIMFLWFGIPGLIVPVIEFIYPQTETEQAFYVAAGVYYGGAILSKIFGSLVFGFLLSAILACLYISKVELKQN